MYLNGRRNRPPIALVWCIAALLMMLLGCSPMSQVSSGKSDTSNVSRRAKGTTEDWLASACQYGRYARRGTIPLTIPMWMCSGNPSGEFTTMLFVYQYRDQAEMQAHPEHWNHRYSYATCTAADDSATVFVSDVAGIGSRDAAQELTDRALEPLAQFGCSITHRDPYAATPTLGEVPRVDPPVELAPAPMTPIPPTPSLPMPAPQRSANPDSYPHWTFQSKTGNIICDLDGASGRGVASCEVRNHFYQPEVKSSCQQSHTNRFTLIEGKPVSVECYPGTDFPSGLPVQDYGRPLTVGSITCVIDRESGITCRVTGTGHFFRAARQSYEWR